MRICDAHCHIDRLVRLTGQARALGDLGPTLAVSNDWLSYLATLTIIGRQHNIHASLGLHPHLASSRTDDLPLVISRLPNARFVGEVGLDYMKCTDAKSRENQRSAFEAILEACEGTRKVLNVHSTGAEKDVLSILQSFNVHQVVMHWYIGPLRILKVGIDEGWHFSIPPAVCRSNKLQEVAIRVPKDQILVESDAPSGLDSELSVRGALKKTVGQIAQLWHTSSAYVREVTTSNFLGLLGGNATVSPDQRSLRNWTRSIPQSQPMDDTSWNTTSSHEEDA